MIIRAADILSSFKTVEVGAMAQVEGSRDAVALAKKALTVTSTGKIPYTLELFKELGGKFYIPRIFADGRQVTGKWDKFTINPNITLRPEQVKMVAEYLTAVKTFSPYGGIIKSAPGCVDADTEFMTPHGWKKIADYLPGDMVLQYNIEDDSAEFVKPLRFIKEESEYLWQMKTKYGVNQCLSDEHRVLYVPSDGKRIDRKKIISFSQLRERDCKTKFGFSGQFITTFTPRLNTSLPQEDSILRILVAICADGHMSGNRVYFNLKKERKVRRLENLLHAANILYKKTQKINGYSLIAFKPPGIRPNRLTGTPGWVRDKKGKMPADFKVFSSDWYQCSLKQLEVVSQESLYWDGNCRNQYYSTIRINADFIQYAFTATGFRARILEDKRIGKPVTYTVQINKRILIGITNSQGHHHIEPYKTVDGFKYCFEVPSSFLVLRREGCIFITGNSGKTVIGVSLLCHFGYKTLIIVPTDRLMDQWRERLKTFSNLCDDEIGIIRQNKCDVENKMVVIGMIHSLAKAATKYPHISELFGFVIWDETQVLGAESFSNTAGFFNCKYRLSLSATPRRKDGMDAVFLLHIGQVVSENKKIKIHPRVIFQTYKGQDTSHSGFIWRGELNTGRYLNKIASSVGRNTMIANAIIMAYNKGRDILVISDRLKQLEYLKQMIGSSVKPEDIGLFTGQTKQLDRKILLATYGSASMGADLPRLSTLILATPRVDLEQTIGRICRDTEGRMHDPVVIDIVDGASSIMRNWAKARLKLYKKYTEDIVGTI